MAEVKEEKHHHHHHHHEKVGGVTPFLLSTKTLYNANQTVYLDYAPNTPSGYYPTVDATNPTWDINTVSNLYFLGSPRDTSTPYQTSSQEYLTYTNSTNSISMDPYNGVNSIMTMTQDINSYWLITPYNNSTTKYLRSDSSGNLSFSTTLDDSARWTRASDGSNYKFSNKNYSTLYLQAMSNGHLTQASSYSSNNQFDWIMTAQNVVTINIDGLSGYYLYNSSGSPALGDDNGTGTPIGLSYYWVQRSAPGGASNFFFESVSALGTYLQSDSGDGIPIMTTGFQYSDQPDATENWYLS